MGGPGVIHLECGSGWCAAQDPPDWDCGDAGAPPARPARPSLVPRGLAAALGPWDPASCPQARVLLAEVCLAALPSHRPPSPELAEVCVAQRAWKSDPGLGEGKGAWSWNALGGP